MIFARYVEMFNSHIHSDGHSAVSLIASDGHTLVTLSIHAFQLAILKIALKN